MEESSITFNDSFDSDADSIHFEGLDDIEGNPESWKFCDFDSFSFSVDLDSLEGLCKFPVAIAHVGANLGVWTKAFSFFLSEHSANSKNDEFMGFLPICGLETICLRTILTRSQPVFGRLNHDSNLCGTGILFDAHCSGDTVPGKFRSNLCLRELFARVPRRYPS